MAENSELLARIAELEQEVARQQTVIADLERQNGTASSTTSGDGGATGGDGGTTSTAPSPTPTTLPPLAQEALAEGNKTRAVKLVRDAYRISLKEAKDLVEEAASRQGL